MSKPTPSLDFLAFIPYAIESDWDDIWAPRLADFRSTCLCGEDRGCWAGQRRTFSIRAHLSMDEQSRQMRYRPAIDSDFSVLVKLHRDGGIDTFKYRGSELICEASGVGLSQRNDSHDRMRLSPREPIDNRDLAVDNDD